MARESAVEPDGLRVVDGDGEGVGLKNVLSATSLPA